MVASNSNFYTVLTCASSDYETVKGVLPNELKSALRIQGRLLIVAETSAEAEMTTARKKKTASRKR